MIADVKKSAEQKMQKSLEALKVDLSKVRSGRAHTGLLDHVTVDYYGAQTPINQLANINLIDARTIGVIPWEKKMGGAIEKAIRESDLGLNPMPVGETIRVPMPALTEERRRDLIKVVKHEAEAVRVAMRNIRRDANDALKKLKGGSVSEDMIKGFSDQVQKLTDDHIKKMDDLFASKEKDIMTV